MVRRATTIPNVAILNLNIFPPFLTRDSLALKSKQGESCGRIRLGDLSKANAGWARGVEMRDIDLKNRGQEKKRREQKFAFLFGAKGKKIGVRKLPNVFK